MSMYTAVSIKMNIKLTDDDIEELNELMDGNCAIETRKVVSNTSVDIALDFNYGYEKAMSILRFFEGKLSSNVTLRHSNVALHIGTFSTEERSFSSYNTVVIVVDDRVLVVKHECEYGYGFELNHYTIMGTTGEIGKYSGYNKEMTLDIAVTLYLESITKFGENSHS